MAAQSTAAFNTWAAADRLNGWERGYCDNHGNQTGITEAVAPTRGACVVLCVLSLDCQFASFASVDRDCGLYSRCQLPLISQNSMYEKHYTAEMHAGSQLCSDAERAALAAERWAHSANATAVGAESSLAAWLRHAAKHHVCAMTEKETKALAPGAKGYEGIGLSPDQPEACEKDSKY